MLAMTSMQAPLTVSPAFVARERQFPWLCPGADHAVSQRSYALIAPTRIVTERHVTDLTDQSDHVVTEHVGNGHVFTERNPLVPRPPAKRP